MADGNKFKETVESLFQGMDSVVSSKTVVGDAIHINGTIILPLVDVSFGIGAGSFNAEKKDRAGGGIGGRRFCGGVRVPLHRVPHPLPPEHHRRDSGGRRLDAGQRVCQAACPEKAILG